MGLATAIAAATLASTAMQVKSGFESKNEARVQAAQATTQAAQQAEETRRVTARRTELEQREIDRTADRQKLMYLASGVALEGSPLLKLEETRRFGAENIDEIQKAGEAEAEAELTEGRMTAQRAKSTGRQALTQSLMGAGSTLSGLL